MLAPIRCQGLIRALTILWVSRILSATPQQYAAFDETMWTRGTLQDFTVAWPAAKVASLAKASDAWNHPGELVSSLGPQSKTSLERALQTQARANDRLGPVMHVAAAEALKCDMCHSVVGNIWAQQIDHLHWHWYERRQNPDAEFTPLEPEESLSEVCGSVPEEMLSTLTIKQVTKTVEGSGDKPMQLVFFTLQDREFLEAPTDVELKAARKSCQDVVTGMSSFNAAAPVLRAIKQYADMYGKAWVRHVWSHPERASAPPIMPGCGDEHELCEAWASVNECEKNPAYMLERCMLACGVCHSPTSYPWQYLPHPAVQELQEFASSELTRLETAICSNACRHPSSPSLSDISAGSLGALPSLLDELLQTLAYHKSRSPLLSDPENPDPGNLNAAAGKHGAGTAKPRTPAHSAPLATSEAGAGVGSQGPPGREGGGARGAPGVDVRPRADVLMLYVGKAELLRLKLAAPELLGMAVPPSPGVPEGVLQVVDAALKDTCIVLHKGWWIYELCYGRRIRQYHIEQHHLAQQNILGYFEGDASLTQRPKTTSGDVKHSGGTVLNQLYSGGEECGGNVTVLQRRKAKVVYGCAADGVLRMEIHEPFVCQYVVLVHLPELCRLPDFAKFAPAKSEQVPTSPQDSSAGRAMSSEQL